MRGRSCEDRWLIVGTSLDVLLENGIYSCDNGIREIRNRKTMKLDINMRINTMIVTVAIG